MNKLNIFIASIFIFSHTHTQTQTVPADAETQIVEAIAQAQTIQADAQAKIVRAFTKAQTIQADAQAKIIQAITKAQTVQADAQSKMVQAIAKAKKIPVEAKAQTVQAVAPTKTVQADAQTSVHTDTETKPVQAVAPVQAVHVVVPAPTVQAAATQTVQADVQAKTVHAIAPAKTVHAVAKTVTQDDCEVSMFDLAFTSGFIWKNDKNFKKVYGDGILDLITIDGCYYPCNYGGIGVKVSYWEKKGTTSCLKKCTKLQEIPLIFYLRSRIGSWLQGYISLGGGVIFVKEKSYLGCVNKNVGIGEAEVGFNYYPCENVYLTAAFRYLFPRQKFNGDKIDFGGFGLRGGIGFSY